MFLSALSSCCDLRDLQVGDTEFNERYEKYTELNDSPPSWIDTNAVYRKLYDSTAYGEGHSFIYRDTAKTWYMKFYGNSRYVEFSVDKERDNKIAYQKVINARKAILGYYKVRKNKLCQYIYAPHHCNRFLRVDVMQKNDKGDLLTEYRGIPCSFNAEKGTYFSRYEKVNTTIGWLPKKPDW